MSLVVDDHLLLALLSSESPSVEPAEAIFTTGCWHYRLARAIAPRWRRDLRTTRRSRGR
ncbi:MAG TPA: hypothetical protein VMD59_22395 [Acidimicrobiales bacterium]|nr:hypothetical protein [Acidimicrobiales bacterium]